jgi:hypothetical protein
MICGKDHFKFFIFILKASQSCPLRAWGWLYCFVGFGFVGFVADISFVCTKISHI